MQAVSSWKKSLSVAAALTVALIVLSFSNGTRSQAEATAPANCPVNLLDNAGFELPVETIDTRPLGWGTRLWFPSMSTLVRDPEVAHSGSASIKITTPAINDSWFYQEVNVEPETTYLLSGWIKTINATGGGANLSVVGTSQHTEALLGNHDWTLVRLWFNSGSNTQVTIGARLGFTNNLAAGTAWFDDLSLTALPHDTPHPRWKILVLIYDRTDALLTDRGGVRHHMVGSMTPAEVERAAAQATQFVQTDIPALTSGNMIPELAIRYPDHALTNIDPFGDAWSPSPANTAPDSDASFDSVLVIWDPRVVDQYTGTSYWIGPGAGLAYPMGTHQTYATIIIEATGYGHRNVFKHEWGHCILFYFEAAGTAPTPTVTNHAVINQYVHWPTGDPYVWADETDANPIPNSIYSNEAGFTHDYYSGTTATADQPTRRLGVTPEAWSLGGPVTKPGSGSPPPPVITCGGNVTVAPEPGTCWARVSLPPPTGTDGCETSFIPVATRSDGLPMDAPYSCGQTVVTWTVPNSEASCQQIVTVNDTAPPSFIHFPQPVMVTTGPSATSCGAVVEDARIGTTVASTDPVELDAIGDAAAPSFEQTNDIVSAAATEDAAALTFTIPLTQPVFLASSGNPRGLIGLIEIDSDSNSETGVPSILAPQRPFKYNMGVEFQIDLGSESAHPGLVDVILTEGGPVVIGKAPIVVIGNSFSITVPLTLLGHDNGLVKYAVGVGMVGFGSTDFVPNGPIPIFSRAAPELLARDDCAGLIVTSIGVPANNYFPVGETLITYTATDANGNSSSLTQKVTVIDDTPPLISRVTTNPSMLWPPNHGMVDVTVNYDATDNCGISETSLTVSSDDPAAAPDCEVVDAHHVRLRARRSPRWGDRIYTITITAKDIHGNSSSQNVSVRVPQHNEKGGI